MKRLINLYALSMLFALVMPLALFFAQTNPLEFHLWNVAGKLEKKFESYDIYEKHKIVPFQWYSTYYIGHYNIAVNVVVNEDELRALWSDSWMIWQALYIRFYEIENHIETSELYKRGYRINWHRPGQYYPMSFYYQLVKPDAPGVMVREGGDTGPIKALGDHPDGWFVRFIDVHNVEIDKIPIAVKEIEKDAKGQRQWIISAALFMILK